MQLHLLLIGQGPDMNILTDFLMRREGQVEHCPDGARAAEYVLHRRRQRQPYHVVLVDADTAGIDPMNLGVQLQQADQDLSMALMVDFMQAQQSKGPADQVGYSTVLDKPLDFSVLERYMKDQEHFRSAGIDTRPHPTSRERLSLSGQHRIATGRERASTSGGYRPTTARHGLGGGGPAPHNRQNDATPFFGTSRIGEGSGTQAQLPITGVESRAATGRRRTVSQQSTTTRVRRSVSGNVTRQDVPTAAGDAWGDASPSSSVQSIAVAQKHVQCAYCQQVFAVVVRQEAYTMPCIHCGQLNRIMP